MHVEIAGRGPPLVMLHGWGLNLRVFDTLVPALTDQHRVLRVDLPGHGKSPWKQRAAGLAAHAMLVRDVLRTHTTEPCAVLGWSLGGQIALELAAVAPDRVERLALIATTPRFTASIDWPHGMSTSVLNGFAHRLESDWRATVSEFLELQVRGSADGERVLRELRATLLTHGETQPAALAAGLAALATSDVRARLEAIAQPALVIAGQYDRITPPQGSRALADALDARYLEVRRAGHAPFLSHPREVAGAVRDFLL